MSCTILCASIVIFFALVFTAPWPQKEAEVVTHAEQIEETTKPATKLMVANAIAEALPAEAPKATSPEVVAQSDPHIFVLADELRDAQAPSHAPAMRIIEGGTHGYPNTQPTKTVKTRARHSHSCAAA